MRFRRSLPPAAALVLAFSIGAARLASAAPPPPLHIVSGYDVKGLALWLDAEHGATADAQGHVTQLVDHIGNFTLTPPAQGQGPTLVPKALNGHAVFRFDGSQFLYSPENFGNALDHAMTFVIVAKSTAPAIDEQFPLYLGPHGDQFCNRSLCHYMGKEYFDGHYVGCYGEPVVTNAYIMDGASLNPARTRATFYRNGRSMLTSRISLENDGAQFDQLADGVTLGAAPDGVFGWQGDIAEELVFNHELTAAEMKGLWTALAVKYALR